MVRAASTSLGLTRWTRLRLAPARAVDAPRTARLAAPPTTRADLRSLPDIRLSSALLALAGALGARERVGQRRRLVLEGVASRAREGDRRAQVVRRPGGQR